MDCENRGIRDVLRAATAACLLVVATAAAFPSVAGASPRGGVLLSFGEDAYGQLGVGAIEMSNATPREVAAFEHEAEAPGPEPREKLLEPDAVSREPIVAVAAGATFSLAVTSQGELDAFGSNRSRQLALEWANGEVEGTKPVDHPTAAQIALRSGEGVIAQVAAGAGDGFAVTTTGSLIGWGENNHGQAGTKAEFDPDECAALSPGVEPKLIKLPNEERAAEVAAGRYFTLARTQAGKVFGFGSNRYGQLGMSRYFGLECGANDYEPQEVSFPSAENGERIVDVATGLTASFAVTAGGRLFAFGNAEYGATGRESSLPSDEASEVALGGERVEQVAAGGHFTLIRTRTGAVYSLGQNRFGQLGRETGSGTSESDHEALRVALPTDAGKVVHVAAGEESALLVTEGGRLYTFGEDDFGQLGWTVNLEEPGLPVTTFGTNHPNWLPQPVTLPGALRAEDVALGPLAEHGLVIAGEPGVQTSVLHRGRVGSRYEADLAADGGRAPYTWSASGLPPGIRLDGERGTLSGIPRRTGRYEVRVAAVDAFGIRSTATLHVLVVSRGPGIDDLRMASSRWGARGRLSFRLTQPARVRVHICALSRRGCRALGTLDEHARSGRVRLSIPSHVRIAGRRMAAGSYELFVTASDRAGTTSSRRLEFTVR